MTNKNITKIALSAAVALSSLFMPSTAMAQRGEKTVGIQVGYATRNSSTLAGIYLDYRFSRYFALTPSVDYVFRSEGTDAFLFNIDGRFPFRLDASSRFEIYPLVGINYASWNYHWEGHGDHPFNDVSTRRSRFGLSVGAGIDYKVTKTLKLSFQGKYNGVEHLSTGLFTLGIGYCF